MPNPTAAMIVIGDEILSGRTRDANMYHLAGKLTEKGVSLQEVRVVSDESPAIIEAVNTLRGRVDHVFTSGGIGPTHDDITADAVAEAFGVGIDVRADARSILEEHYTRNGQALTEARLRMARIPEGALLIDNPISAAPGFSLGNVHVMAGVPAIFEAMLESVLSLVTGGTPLTSVTVRVDRGEGDLAGPLSEIARTHGDVSLGSYPFQKDGRYGSNIVIRGTNESRVASVASEVRAAFDVRH